MYLVVVSSVMMFYICFAVESTTAAKNGYIVAEHPEIPCKDSSTAIAACSGSLDYKIPDFKNFPDAPDLSEARNVIALGVRAFGVLGDEKCAKAGTKYLCEGAYPFRCGDTYLEVDGNGLAATCKEANKSCSALNATIRASMFNCSATANNPALQQKLPRKLICTAFPVLKDDPYSCEANYKVTDGGNATNLKIVGEQIVLLHKMLKNSKLSDAECEKNIADIICKAPLPACSSDRSKLVHVQSMQDCNKNAECVKKTNNTQLIQIVDNLCAQFPNATTAKTYSLDNVYVYDGKAASHALAFSTVLSIAILVAQSFF